MSKKVFLARLGICFSLALCLFACSMLKPSQTIIQTSVSASNKVNLDSRGRANPIVIRVYLLKNATAFNATDFFSLYDKDQQVLSDSLISREEILLKPGESKTLQSTTVDPNVIIGAIAAFRDIDHAAWRSSTAVVAGKTNSIKISLDNDTITAVAIAK